MPEARIKIDTEYGPSSSDYKRKRFAHLLRNCTRALEEKDVRATTGGQKIGLSMYTKVWFVIVINLSTTKNVNAAWQDRQSEQSNNLDIPYVDQADQYICASGTHSICIPDPDPTVDVTLTATTSTQDAKVYICGDR
jgi:hypothetical protein